MPLHSPDMAISLNYPESGSNGKRSIEGEKTKEKTYFALG